jgi:membrane protein YdbS with pleckstrin-like domain
MKETMRDLETSFESIKDDKEKILWTGRPTFIPFILEGFVSELIIVVFAIGWIFFARPSQRNPDGNFSEYFWLFGLVPVAITFLRFLKKLFSFSNTVYAYSDKRVMMRSGFLATGFKTIDFDKISDMEVSVSIIEKLYNVGTIKFYSGRTVTDDSVTSKVYDSWTSIANPYEVFKMVKQTSVDIKTDFTYPNALRPETNPGYNTKYEPKG